MKRYCKNCFHPLPGKARFCPSCGQKDSDGKVRMSALLRKLWDATFHLEGKFLRTCWQLFMPGKVTLEFFKGKQDRYPHPLRMFAIVMFLFLFMANLVLNRKEQNHSTGGVVSIDNVAVTPEGDTIEITNDISRYDAWKYEAELYDFWRDYEQLPESWRTSSTQKSVDSLLKNYNKRHHLEKPGLPDTLDNYTDTTSIGLWGNKQIKLATFDIVKYTPDEIIQRYEVKGALMQLFVRQSIKSFKNPEALVHAFIGSLTWAILALIAAMSGIMTLLYLRTNRYYVEHFIFLLHYHTGLMLALLISMAGIYFHIWSEMVYLLVFFWATYAMYRGMRRYYGQTRWKTVVKWAIFGISFFVCFILFFVLGILVVFALY